MKIFNDNKILSIEVDSYYKNLAHLSFEQREKNNFDNPASFEFDLLFKQLNELRENKSINLPLYDYKTHTRKKEIELISKIFQEMTSIAIKKDYISKNDVKTLMKKLSHSLKTKILVVTQGNQGVILFDSKKAFYTDD